MTTLQQRFFELSPSTARRLLSSLILSCLWWGYPIQAMDLSLLRSQPYCGVSATAAPLPAQSRAKLLNGQVVAGNKNIAWVWLASPTTRYPHYSLGSNSHAASVHVLLRSTQGTMVQVDYVLGEDRVFEDLSPRLIDLDNDGQDEIVLVEASVTKGAALVVLGVSSNATSPSASPFVIKELARSPYAGGFFRWLNPVGAADFDGDGRLDLAAVITPHIGGTLTLYRYQPPLLIPFAKVSDVSNHRMGDPEQRMAVIVPATGRALRPTIILPDMSLKALYALRLGTDNQWLEIDKVKTLPAAVSLLIPSVKGACALLSDGSWWEVGLLQ